MTICRAPRHSVVTRGNLSLGTRRIGRDFSWLLPALILDDTASVGQDSKGPQDAAQLTSHAKDRIRRHPPGDGCASPHALCSIAGSGRCRKFTNSAQPVLSRLQHRRRPIRLIVILRSQVRKLFRHLVDDFEIERVDHSRDATLVLLLLRARLRLLDQRQSLYQRVDAAIDDADHELRRLAVHVAALLLRRELIQRVVRIELRRRVRIEQRLASRASRDTRARSAADEPSSAQSTRA